MNFDLNRWKEQIRARLPGIRDSTTFHGVHSLYGLLGTLALTPAAQALAQGQEAAVLGLLTVAGSVGGSLLATQIENLRQHVSQGDGVDEQNNEVLAQMANSLAQQASESAELRQALDVMFKRLEVMQQAQQVLPASEHEWLKGKLVKEYKLIVSGQLIVQGDLVFKKEETHYHSAPMLPDPVAKARTRYLDVLAQRCNVLPLAALGGQDGMGEEVSLDEVYVALDTTSRVRLTEEEKKLRKWRNKNDRALTALEAATQQRRLVLLGDPGSGKSTFVRQLVADVARACEKGEAFREGWQVGLLPVFVVLRDLAPRLEALRLDGSTKENHEALLGALWAQWREDLSSLGVDGGEESLREALQDGSVLLIFDGLDEVATAWRERVRLAVNALIQRYPQIQRIIVTCRIRSYEGNAQLPSFTQYTLAPFSEEQIKDFIGLWYRAQAGLGRMDGATAQARANDLREAALAAGLRELAQNPMLLTTMALIHQQEVGLPRERVRLYAQAVEVLMIRWQKHKKKQSPALEGLLQDERRLRLIMERLAYEAHQTQSEGDGAGDLRRGELLTLLEDAAYLGELELVGEFLDYVDQRAGLLIGRGASKGKPPLYTFPHRTFQEYLAGCYMVRGRHREVIGKYTERLSEGDYWQLAGELGVEELFYERAGEKEVLDLAYDLCPSKTPTTLSDWRGVLWSGLMAVLVGKEEVLQDAAQTRRNRDYLPRLLNRLLELMQDDHLPPIERAEAGRVLAKLGDPRPEVLEVDEMEFCYVPAGKFWMGAPNDVENAHDREHPLHKVNIPYAYWISRYPVTNAQFEQFVRARGYQKEKFWTEAKAHGVWEDGKVKEWRDSKWREHPYDFGFPFNQPNHPVVGVTFYEALAFIRWLEERWGGVVALPTEVEWEKAARGGEMIPQKALICTASQLNRSAFPAPALDLALIANPLPQRHYPWGNQPDPTRANYDDTGIGSTNAVGCFVKGESPCGCQEMSGNVYQWVQRIYKNYPYSPDYQRERVNLSSEFDTVIIRSGSYFDKNIRVRCFSRDWDDPYYRLDLLGFRVFRAKKKIYGPYDLWTLIGDF